MTPVELCALRAKYEEMLRLRLAAEAGDGADPRRAMADLAARFPGALREIDELPMDDLRARIDELAGAERGGPVARWMEAVHLFHVLTRGALCAKKWLAGRRAVDAAARGAFEREAPSLCWGEDAAAWKGDLERLARPPRGRVTVLVYERMAAILAVPASDVPALVFTPRAVRKPRP